MQIEEKKLYYIYSREISRILDDIKDKYLRCEILADILRVNVVSMVKEGNGGHMGSSLSCLDIIVWLWTQEMTNQNKIDKSDADILFSSKGHDVPAFYALLIGLGVLEDKLLHTFRRLPGLPGHPDIDVTPELLTNTGSLGMGISKARGMAIANRLENKSNKIFVLTGDGELQEGHIWESLQPVANRKLSEITVIVDHNKMQTNQLVSKISDLGDLEKKFNAYGWHTRRCNGHDYKELEKIFSDFKQVKNQPQVLIADTVKAKGVSFMESSLKSNQTGYKYHSGALSDLEYINAVQELVDRINGRLNKIGLQELELYCKNLNPQKKIDNLQFPIEAYGKELVKISKHRHDIIVLDGDLKPDLGITDFSNEFPERFIECGIAEQDMASVAGGLAIMGKLPIVHSYACFISTRPNEQIYNNCTEGKKIIYVGALAGLLPAGPGHSHQSVRDISAMGAMPNIVIFQPSCEQEARLAINWAVNENPHSTYLRFSNIPINIPYKLPSGYRLEQGRGCYLMNKNSELAIISYGQVMLNQAYLAAERLNNDGITAALINFPWLNRADPQWLKNICRHKMLVVIDDHYIAQGLGEFLLSKLAKMDKNKLPKVIHMGIDRVPLSGENDKVLKSHKLDFNSIADQIREMI